MFRWYRIASVKSKPNIYNIMILSAGIINHAAVVSKADGTLICIVLHHVKSAACVALATAGHPWVWNLFFFPACTISHRTPNALF